MAHTKQLGDYAHMFKVVLIGSSGTGKTSLLHQMADHCLPREVFRTIGTDFKVATVSLRGKRVKLPLWDPAGGERFRTIAKAYVRGADAILIVYSVTSRDSFREAEDLFQVDLQTRKPESVVVLVATMIDTPAEQHKVQPHEGHALAARLGVPFVQVSAESGENVSSLLASVSRALVARATGTVAAKKA